MAVFCANCGEELLGAINRCWRCGTQYESRSGNTDVPPIRRAPIQGPLFGALEAEIVEGGPAVDAPVNGPDNASQPDDTSQLDGANGLGGGSGTGGGESDAATEVAQFPRMRRGSPFRSNESAGEADSNAGMLPADLPLATRYPKHGGADVGSVVAIALGLFALILAKVIPPAGLVISCFGLGMGIWGLYSRKRRAATFGLLLCCIAVAISGFFCAAEVYQLIHGADPWEPIP